jgi:hypothetical protein
MIGFDERTDNKEKIGLEGGAKSGQKSRRLFFCREGVHGAWEGTASQIAISNLTPAFCWVGSPGLGLTSLRA